MPITTAPGDGYGPYEPWARPLLLLSQGRRDEARDAVRRIPDSPPDLLFEARTGLHALAAIGTGDRPAMQRLYAALLPAAGELAGAGSGLLTLGPAAGLLAALAGALGQPARAAGHLQEARTLLDRIRNPPAGQLFPPVTAPRPDHPPGITGTSVSP